ncbi:hypothetical protein [Nocardia sp. NPDC056100]|uniref:hypothetical protein n=1 Tax=Nocardia sp. NPDC056100 TaxID=3345712 RepID=UPI0035DB5F2A
MSGQWRAGDLLRRQLGDRRFLLLLPRAVGLQILHPAIAAALLEHAPNRLWAHKKRAITQMIYMACEDRDMRSASTRHEGVSNERVDSIGAGPSATRGANPQSRSGN